MRVNYANFGDLLTKRGVFRMKEAIDSAFFKEGVGGIG